MAARDPGGEKHAVFFCVSLDGLSERGNAHSLMERESTVLPTESYTRNATSSTTSALYAHPRVHREATKIDITSANKNNQRSRPKRYKKTIEEVADSSTSSAGLFFRTARHQKQMRKLKLQQIAKVSHRLVKDAYVKLEPHSGAEVNVIL